MKLVIVILLKVILFYFIFEETFPLQVKPFCRSICFDFVFVSIQKTGQRCIELYPLLLLEDNSRQEK
jgi:hypothetical protein